MTHWPRCRPACGNCIADRRGPRRKQVRALTPMAALAVTRLWVSSPRAVPASQAARFAITSDRRRRSSITRSTGSNSRLRTSIPDSGDGSPGERSSANISACSCGVRQRMLDAQRHRMVPAAATLSSIASRREANIFCSAKNAESCSGSAWLAKVARSHQASLVS
jgi:hypothetical protein